MNPEQALPQRVSIERRQATASLLLLLVLVAGLFTYKSTTALGRLREVQSTGVLRVDPNTLFARGASSGTDLLARSSRYLLIVGPALIFGVLVGGAVRAFVSPSWLLRRFGRGGFREHVAAGVSGAPLMLCSCCVAPVFSAVYERSLSVGPSLALALAAPSLNPAALAMTFMLFRPPLGMARLLMALVAVFIVPAIIGGASQSVHETREHNRSSELTTTGGVFGRFLRSCGHVAVRTVPVIVLGVMASMWLAQRFPIDIPASRPLGTAGLVALVSLLSVPVALPTFFEIPLALTLMAAGAPAGVAAALLFAGPATNLPSLVTIARTTHWRIAALVAIAVAAVACVGGLLVS